MWSWTCLPVSSDHLPPSPSRDKDPGPKYEDMWSPSHCRRRCLKWQNTWEIICSEPIRAENRLRLTNERLVFWPRCPQWSPSAAHLESVTSLATSTNIRISFIQHLLSVHKSSIPCPVHLDTIFIYTVYDVYYIVYKSYIYKDSRILVFIWCRMPICPCFTSNPFEIFCTICWFPNANTKCCPTDEFQSWWDDSVFYTGVLVTNYHNRWLWFSPRLLVSANCWRSWSLPRLQQASTAG